MSFVAPTAFILGVLIAIIVAMYLLKLRRKEQVVSSIYLWQRMVKDVEANAPWQRLRRSLLLFLQILFLVLIILALARPFTWGETAVSQALILIVDTSASMLATDVNPSRLEVAKEQARRLVDGLGDDARVTVIAASSKTSILVTSSQDRRQIRQAIDGLKSDLGEGDLSTALSIAEAIAARQPSTQTVILSDGRVNLPSERRPDKNQAEGATAAIRYQPIGVSGENQAISLLSLELAPTVEGNQAEASLTAFLQVTNYGQLPAERRLLLYTDDRLYNAYDLEIPAGGQKSLIATGLPLASQVAAHLEGEDILALDDNAWAVFNALAPARVALVSEGNLFLETLLFLLPGVDITLVKPDDWRGGEDSDVVVFDAFLPGDSLPKTANLLFIAPPRSTDFFTVSDLISQPSPRVLEAADPLLAYVNLDDVHILDALRIQAPDWAKIHVIGETEEGEEVPLLFSGVPTGGREQRIAVLAFDLHHSDLPLRQSFPLLFANLMDWLAPGRGGRIPSQVAPGEVVTLPLPAEMIASAKMTVTRPDGMTVYLEPGGGTTIFADTTQLGVYRLSWGGDCQAEMATCASFAVNLFSPLESDLAPVASLANITTSESLDSANGTSLQRARREWWRQLALAALVILTLEWLVYRRATLSTWLGHVHAALRRGIDSVWVRTTGR